MFRRCTGTRVIDDPLTKISPPLGCTRPRDHAQAGGLAAAAGAKQRDKLARFYAEGEAVDRGMPPVMLGQVRQADGGRLCAQTGQLPKTWLYFSNNPGRIGLMYDQSQANRPISSILVSG